MLRLFFILSFLISAQSALADTNCAIYEKTDSGVYDKKILKFEIKPSDDQGDTTLVYLKTDGSVVKYSYKEIENKTDWSDLNHSTFFTAKISTAGSLEIGYGDVDTSRPPETVRHLISLGDADQKMVLWAGDNFNVSCGVPFDDQ